MGLLGTLIIWHQKQKVMLSVFKAQAWIRISFKINTTPNFFQPKVSSITPWAFQSVETQKISSAMEHALKLIQFKQPWQQTKPTQTCKKRILLPSLTSQIIILLSSLIGRSWSYLERQDIIFIVSMTDKTKVYIMNFSSL